MYSLIQREIQATPNGTPPTHGQVPASTVSLEAAAEKPTIPAIFTDPGYNLLGTSVLSTSNCGNPALRVSFQGDAKVLMEALWVWTGHA